MGSRRACGGRSSIPSGVDAGRCPECESTELELLPFLEPGGFAVDHCFHIHDDASNLGAASPVNPWVSAPHAQWRALPDPTVGRIRTSSDGLVFRSDEHKSALQSLMRISYAVFCLSKKTS